MNHSTVWIMLFIVFICLKSNGAAGGKKHDKNKPELLGKNDFEPKITENEAHILNVANIPILSDLKNQTENNNACSCSSAGRQKRAVCPNCDGNYDSDEDDECPHCRDTDSDDDTDVGEGDSPRAVV